MAKTKIEWVRNPDGTPGVVWNPVTSCSKVSEGCRNCYAESLARRFRKDFRPWTAANAEHNVRLHPERLEQPLRWRKPRRVFVNSVSDLFHEQVQDEFINDVLASIAATPRHTYQVLTKRQKRMMQFMNDYQPIRLRNLWLGVSAEDQPTFDERTKYLLQTPAAVRFVSLEPLLSAVDLIRVHSSNGIWSALSNTGEDWQRSGAKLDWVIVGGESGPGARPMHPDWVRSIRDQCQASGVPFFLKQMGEWLWKDAPETFDGKLAILKEPGAKRIYKGGYFHRVGKKAAGNVLDGRIWEEMPK